MKRRDGALVGGAAAIWALANFVCLWFARHDLDEAGYKEFLVYWAILFSLFGVLSGVMNESTRAAGAVVEGRPPGARLLGPAAVLGLVTSALVVVASPVVARRVPTGGIATLALLVAAGITYALYICVVGAAAGLGAWRGYAGLLTAEALARTLLLATAAAAGLGMVPLQAACLAALVVVLPALAWRQIRAAAVARSDAPFSPALGKMAMAVASTSCTALLVSAYPAFLDGTDRGSAPALTAALILAVSLCRAPIMMPLTLFQGVAIRSFLAHRAAPLRAIRRPALALLGIGALGAVAAWIVGPGSWRRCSASPTCRAGSTPR